MNRAFEIFSDRSRHCNCAQAVAAAFGRRDLLDELQGCSVGRAPEGRCGALHAARLLVGPEKAPLLEKEFAEKLGSPTCRRLKKELHIPCSQCISLAEELVERLS